MGLKVCGIEKNKIGGGAIGCEMAQAFSCLGTKCTIILMDDYLIPSGD